MIDRNSSDKLDKDEEIIQRVLDRIQTPNSDSFGNSAGAYQSIPTFLRPVDPLRPYHPDEHDGDSGTDEFGNEFYPFILGIDSPFLNSGAYVVWSNARKDYGN